MSTPFCFEHEFRARSAAAVFAAYFDPAHQQAQDQQLDIVERSVLELEDDGELLRRVCRVVPRRQLPRLVQSLVRGRIEYREAVRWRRRDNEIDIEILPSLLGGRAKIDAVYRLSQLSDQAIHRRYAGSVSVDVAVFASRIERGIISELARSLPVAAACTQGWLDRDIAQSRSLSAEA